MVVIMILQVEQEVVNDFYTVENDFDDWIYLSSREAGILAWEFFVSLIFVILV